jgi:TetR/AcrR family transcriptional regulator, regulator of autoinduction and epiphytic fitness
MDQTVKPPGRRQRKALETRRRVLDAAESLFVSDGYSSTTVAAIAEAADVAVQTVYAVFGTKRAVLTALLAVRTVGDDEAAPLRDRKDWQAMEVEPDPRRQVALLANIATRIGARMAPLYDVMAEAAGSDSEIAEVYRQQQEARYKDQRRLARSLGRKGVLRADLSETRATDIMWALANPRTHRALVGERRWPTEEYEVWLGELLACALLGDPATGVS